LGPAQPVPPAAEPDDLAAVMFRGVPHRGTKRYVRGTHRLRDPAETYHLIAPFLPEAGVTRITDVTGLDRIGVPTTLTLRPNSHTIACSSGKGLTLDQAYVSGAMEAFELHAAENAVLPSSMATFSDLAATYSMPAVEAIPLRQSNIFSLEWALLLSGHYHGHSVGISNKSS
jgi:ribosomal protein S12 methylthiotransferase accessory factor